MNHSPTKLTAAMPPPLYYQAAIGMLAPIYQQIVKRKSANLPTLSRELDERFGKSYGAVPSFNGDGQPSLGVIWCHAVSLGELNTAYPLLRRLMQAGFSLWITSTTQTGFKRATTLFSEEILAGRVNHSFIPVDKTEILTSFIDHIKPAMALFIETELWANTLYLLKRRGVPSLMINARLTEKSYRGYQRFRAVAKSMMINLHGIIAQDAASVQRFRQLGMDDKKITLADSLKWHSVSGINEANQKLASDFTKMASAAHKSLIWIMASTHNGEEALALAAHHEILKQVPDALLILVPRHPERFNAVMALCTSSGLSTAQRSKDDILSADTQVFLADSMGELMAWYAAADVAVVGGSFIPVGGHNPIEPASLAKPIIMGQFDTNCTELVAALSDVGALHQLTAEVGCEPSVEAVVQGFALSLADAVLYLKSEPERGLFAKALVDEKQHCVDMQLQPILAILKSAEVNDNIQVQHR